MKSAGRVLIAEGIKDLRRACAEQCSVHCKWFRTCSSTGRFASETDRAADPLIAEIVAAPGRPSELTPA